MPRRPKKMSALDLEILGTAGSFRVGKAKTGDEPSDPASVEVRYILTHVRLGTQGDQGAKLVDALRPVREIFPPDSLTFDQIMQRDIDDARVSNELIPYLLSEGAAGRLKLLPPIVAVVLPVKNRKPLDYYPTVVVSEEFHPDLAEEGQDSDSPNAQIARSGEKGVETFEFRQLIEAGIVDDHNYASLKLNTGATELVIVDGQHRAMAMIALHRNVDRWPNDTVRAMPYYAIWTDELIKKYDLSEAKLPVMLCVFPGLDGADTSLPKVHQACRDVFLVLNRSARPVTAARNVLLDDSDLISSFMRDTLEKIRSTGVRDQNLRLWCVELDASADRRALGSGTVTITGVGHLYGLIERMMLGSFVEATLSVKAEHLRKKQTLDTAVKRLALGDKVSADVQRVVRRRNVGDHGKTAKTFRAAFESTYGELIVKGLAGFAPYRASNDAAREHHDRLSAGVKEDFYLSLLYGGQGQLASFRSFTGRMVPAFKDELPSIDSAKFDTIAAEFRGRSEELERQIAEFKDLRRLELVSQKNRLITSPQVRAALDGIFERTVLTAAFQNALFLTFVGAVDNVNSQREKSTPSIKRMTDDEVLGAFEEYLADLNAFFAADTRAGLRRLIETLQGRMTGTGKATEVIPYKDTLRTILISGELKPDEWPKFRVLLLQLWRPDPANSDLREFVDRERDRTWILATSALRESRKREKARELAVVPGSLDDATLSDIEKAVVAAMKRARRILSGVAHPPEPTPGNGGTGLGVATEGVHAGAIDESISEDELEDDLEDDLEDELANDDDLGEDNDEEGLVGAH